MSRLSALSPEDETVVAHNATPPNSLVPPPKNNAEPVTVTTRLSGRLVALIFRGVWLLIWSLSIIALMAAVPAFRDRLLADAVRLQTLLGQVNVSVESYVNFRLVVELLIVLPGLIFGLFLFLRKPDNLMVVLISSGIATFATVSGAAVPAMNALPWGWLTYTLIVYSLMIALLVILVLPDGRFYPKWTFWIIPVFLTAELVINYPPLGLTQANNVWSAWRLLRNLIFLAMIAVPAYRYRVYFTQQQRQQTKMLVAGIAVITICSLLVSVIRLVLIPTATAPAVWFLLFFVVEPFIRIAQYPIAFVLVLFALMRYRLWEVDLIISRGLIVVTLTAVLGAAFFGGIYVLQTVFLVTTGTTQVNVAFLVSALAIGALFQPARKRIQQLVDRQLYGIKVDFRKPVKPVPSLAVFDFGASTKQYGAYHVTDIIGRGGMGEVYKGQQDSLSREVAIKVLSAAKASDEGFRARFEREAKIVAALRHPNIVQLFDYGQADAEVYMVMEYINGIGLDAYLRQQGPLPVNAVQALLTDICSALDYAHQNGVVHRDIKPSNVMLQPFTTQVARRFGYRAVLMDFGVARVASERELTNSGVVLGTFDYMSPEQITGSRNVTYQADIYSLGVMLYQMMTGKMPFAGDNPGMIVFSHLQRPPPDPRLLQPTIPMNCVYAIHRAMAKNPAERFISALELAQTIAS